MEWNGIPGLRHRGVASPKNEATEKRPQINPFIHNLTLTTYDRIKVYLLTIILLPLRLVAMSLCLLTAYLLACIGTLGLTDEELTQKPMKGWRRSLAVPITAVSRTAFRLCGYRVRVIGKQATAREAPLLLFAPHSTFLDAFVAHWTALPCLIVRSQDKESPIFGKLINYTQPVYVWREDPNSRQNTIKEIVRRATSTTDDWQQVLIFPEGTCTNRTGLITFKPGAFYPGVPVQPVCIRYPNRLDTLSWTWQGPGALELLWLTLTQFCTYCELEFLPVYVPSEEEKRDPHLFANNVRKVMANALQLPVVDYSYEDCRVMNEAKKLGLPATVGLVGVSSLREEFSLSQQAIEQDFLKAYSQMANPDDGLVTLQHFASYLHLPINQSLLVELFQLYDSDRTGALNLEKFIRGRCNLIKALKKISTSVCDWHIVQSQLQLSDEEKEHLQQLMGSFSPETNENDFLDNLYAAMPEWKWIISNLSLDGSRA